MATSLPNLGQRTRAKTVHLLYISCQKKKLTRSWKHPTACARQIEKHHPLARLCGWLLARLDHAKPRDHELPGCLRFLRPDFRKLSEKLRHIRLLHVCSRGQLTHDASLGHGLGSLHRLHRPGCLHGSHVCNRRENKERSDRAASLMDDGCRQGIYWIVQLALQSGHDIGTWPQQ